jgi:hypothetical protein
LTKINADLRTIGRGPLRRNIKSYEAIIGAWAAVAKLEGAVRGKV